MTEISEETLRGLYLILCGISTNYSSSQASDKARPLMKDAHEEILRLGRDKGFDIRGFDL